MAVSTKVITTKIRSVKNIGKITRAMELVAAAKMKPAIDRSVASREYAARILEIVRNVSSQAGVRHPLMTPGSSGKMLVVVVGANKGLCGSYNASLTKAFIELLRTNELVDIALVPVGKYADRLSKHERVSVSERFGMVEREPSLHDAKEIANHVVEQYMAKEYGRAVVLYTQYRGALSYAPVSQPLLPVRLDAVAAFQDTVGNMDKMYATHAQENMSNYLLEPTEEELLDAALPRLLASQVYQAMLEARASEHSARMFAMKNASDNAKSLVDDLTLSYNQARQGAITNELTEIVAGADAL